MSVASGIEWTESTWNPATGCTKVSQGCKHCYAERDWKRLSANPLQPAYHGRGFTDVRIHPERLQLPLYWTRGRRIFVNSMSDLFHEEIPFEFIDSVFAVMSCTQRHTYQVLTKRPQRMLEYFARLMAIDDGFTEFPSAIDATKVWPQWTPCRNGKAGYDCCGPAWPLDNVWLGVSVEDQATAEERIGYLLQAPAIVRFISAEPVLGPIDLGAIPYDRRERIDALRGPEWQPGRALDWVIAGGESGPEARPTRPEWVRSLRDQCASAGVAFFFKQWGEWAPDPHDELGMVRMGKKRAGRKLDGRTHDAYPDRSRAPSAGTSSGEECDCQTGCAAQAGRVCVLSGFRVPEDEGR